MAPTQGDARFARLQTDPRFRRPKQKAVKVEIDERFRDVLESEEFGGRGKGKGKGRAAEARVDKRGKPLKADHHADQLKRFYRLRSESPSGSTSQEPAFIDYARGEGVLQSSGSEDESGEESDFSQDELELGGKRSARMPVDLDQSDSDSESGSGSESGSSDGDHLDIDLSETEPFPEADADDDNNDEEEEEEGESIAPTKRIAAVNLDWDNLRASDLYAVFNSFLQLRKRSKTSGQGVAGDLGKVLNVTIYPSTFGKERMEREEKEGPAAGIFTRRDGASGRSGAKAARVEGEVEDSEYSEDGETDGEDEYEDEDEDEDDGNDESGAEEDGEDEAEDTNGLEIVSDVSSDNGEEGDVDMDKLRQYQLERLRYFYAVAEFSTVAAAEFVMEECNGTEFERTANMFDLSYVPEEMDFTGDEVKDEADSEPKGYKGNDFVTDALRHSKVKLTWDQDDPNRAKMTRRTMTREEIEEADFKNLVASSGSEAGSGSEPDSDSDGDVPDRSSKTTQDKAGSSTKADTAKKSKKTKKERVAALRALLLNPNESDDEAADVWGKAGQSHRDELQHVRNGTATASSGKADKNGAMEITFKPALSGALGDKDEEDMTTLEKYQLRMKEKKARKKEKMELKKASKDAAEDSDGEDQARGKGDNKGQTDDFFGNDSEEEEDEAPKASKKKPLPLPKSKDTPKPEEESRAVPAIAVPSATANDHFSMKDILRLEKEASSKGKKKRKRSAKGKQNDLERETELGPEGWKIDVKDDRFKVLHEEPEFAIDPSNPHFTKTQAMKDLLAERAEIRAKKSAQQPQERKLVSHSDTAPGVQGKDRDLNALAESLKRKMERGGAGKGKKRSRKH